MAENFYKSTVIICTHQPSFHLSQMVASIENCNLISSIYIFDWGSTDESQKLISTLASDFDIEIITNFNNDAPGPAASFLKAIKYVCKFDREATHFYLADQDDVWSNNKVSEYSLYYRTNMPHLIISDVELVDECLRPLSKMFYGSTFNYPRKDKSAIFFNPIIGMTMCLNRSLLEKVAAINFHKSIIMHDWLIFLLVTFCEFEFTCVNEKLVFYRQHKNNFLGVNKKTFFQKIQNSRAHITKVRNQYIFLCHAGYLGQSVSTDKFYLTTLLLNSPLVNLKFKFFYLVAFLLFW